MGVLFTPFLRVSSCSETPARRVRRVQASLQCLRPLTWEYCLPPSCGFPPKSFPLKREPTISGDTFGTRARGRPRTAPPRRRHVMPLAMRPLREESGALLAHFTSALGTHTVAAALKRASPCERLVSGSTPNEITSCQATSRSGFSLNRLRKSVRRVWGRLIKCLWADALI